MTSLSNPKMIKTKIKDLNYFLTIKEMKKKTENKVESREEKKGSKPLQVIMGCRFGTFAYQASLAALELSYFTC